MTEQSNGSLSPRTISLLIAVAVAAMISVFASDMKRLSDEIAALNAASARPQVSPLSAPPPAPTAQKRGAR